MKQVQQVFDWATPAPTPSATARLPPIQAAEPIASAELQDSPATVSTTVEAPTPVAAEREEGPPLAQPLPQAVAAGIFGMTTDGPAIPDDEATAEITAEHAHEMIVLLADTDAVGEAIRTGHDPRTGRVPKTPEARARLAQHLVKEARRLTDAYADAVAVYAEAFGEEAAATLDAWVRKVVADRGPSRESYEPSHPWHYFHAGDNAPPLPAEEIPADMNAGQFIESDLPRSVPKRIARLREMAEREREQLEADTRHYAEGRRSAQPLRPRDCPFKRRNRAGQRLGAQVSAHQRGAWPDTKDRTRAASVGSMRLVRSAQSLPRHRVIYGTLMRTRSELICPA